MRGEKGFSLIETVVAVAIVAIVAVSFLSGLAASARATIVADEHTTASSLARSQMEDIKNQPYDDTNEPPVYSLISGIPSGYTVDIDADRLDPENDGFEDDDGIQKMVVTVERGGRTILTLEDYKVDR